MVGVGQANGNRLILFPRIKDGFFPSKNSPKDLDPSCKTGPDL